MGGAETGQLGPQGFRSLCGSGIWGRTSCRGSVLRLVGCGQHPSRDAQRCLPTLSSTRVRGKITALSPPTPALMRDETPTQLCSPGWMALLGWGLHVQRPPVLSLSWRLLGKLPAGVGGRLAPQGRFSTAEALLTGHPQVTPHSARALKQRFPFSFFHSKYFKSLETSRRFFM